MMGLQAIWRGTNTAAGKLYIAVDEAGDAPDGWLHAQEVMQQKR
jgi:hypothetical protein